MSSLDCGGDRKLSMLISFRLTSTSCCLLASWHRVRLRLRLCSSCSCANYYLLILISLSSPVVIPSAMPQATDRSTLRTRPRTRTHLLLWFEAGRQAGQPYIPNPLPASCSFPLPDPNRSVDSQQIEMCAKSGWSMRASWSSDCSRQSDVSTAQRHLKCISFSLYAVPSPRGSPTFKHCTIG